jgi:hypothetical protein
MSRTQFVQKLLAGELGADGSLQIERNGPEPRETIRLTAYEVAVFAIVSMADSMEQWFSWQEDIYSRFPAVDHSRQQAVHWAASLWPGPMRPSSRMLSQISGLGQALQHPALKTQLPLPPVFANCSQLLSAGNEAAAVALYWSVIQLDQPLVDLDAATATLEQAVPSTLGGRAADGAGPAIPERGPQRRCRSGRRERAAVLLHLGQCLGQARAVGCLDCLDAYLAAVGPAGQLACAAGQAQQYGAALALTSRGSGV